MGYHHLAFATRDLEGTHRFYSDLLGFELIKVIVGKTPEGGWAKHLFYDTGDGDLIAFWDLHDEKLPEDFSTAISVGLGLPNWVNHVAFRAADLGEIETRRKRWLESGIVVSEVDHGFCWSVYAVDPNGILVEFCTDTGGITSEDRERAQKLLLDPQPPHEPDQRGWLYRPDGAVVKFGPHDS
jgi:catechol 2,3-dioxygenase-like lactoylglutathione lyase family enzyme